jgi:hypothetical protein
MRLFLIAVWAVLFVCYFGIFATRLGTWADDVPYHCYRTSGISRPSDRHPFVDHIYIGVTFVFIVTTIAYATILALSSQMSTGTERTHQRILFVLATINPMTRTQNLIVNIALLQCPLHIYSIFALRTSNEQYLETGSAEKDWGFGQIVAMVLLAANILPVVDGVAGSLFLPRSLRDIDTIQTSAKEKMIKLGKKWKAQYFLQTWSMVRLMNISTPMRSR